MNRPFRPGGSSLTPELRARVHSDGWQPAMDVFETEKTLVVRLDLAGVVAGDVRVTVDGEWLVVRGERRCPAEADLLRHHQLEILFGPFERRLRVPFPFERDQVAANLEEGFLTVVLPRRLPTRRRIEVQGESGEGA